MMLVTGATGTNGIVIIKRLSGRAVAVRAMAHREGSFPKPALEGIECALLVTKSSRKVEAQQLAFIQAAPAAKVCQLAAQPPHAGPIAV